ncbi:hypothetical protein TPHA_0D02750 [Tetrapisispora phaffii CBS 4417]|uniref:FAD dependent oxidoreductase domain-containing protein n=1 Tax=Tetrapisispora phaffii (strain ATCC 24235 / CBS 4417 / NBRC 1672 / NRRL Y-8282 / UCD 70-5) TaxID=1071381 RepID=G8BSU0_TETPH|nr:hypothetical protein TPHA_0D02750 [Tetrapisispora phaffii CBS 4417]CCE62911.1 hypothetical protein TPHA_0D02750 [Tetrapisispora phaffii CBS 4417]
MSNPGDHLKEPLVYQDLPSNRSDGKEHIIIVGGGIIGVTTAYYLTQHPKFSPSTHYITIIESTEVACGASGKAGGLIASWAFPDQIVPLSFKLHSQLNQQFDGEANWGYRRLNALSVEADIKNVKEAQEQRHLRFQRRFIKMRDKSSTSPNSPNSEGQTNVHGNPKDYIANTTSIPCPQETKATGESVELTRDSSESNSLKETMASSVSMTTAESSSSIPADLGTGGLMMRTTQNVLPTAFNWIKSTLVKTWTFIGEPTTTAQIHPLQFTLFLLKKAMDTGAVDLIRGKVIDFKKNDKGEIIGVGYMPKAGKHKDEVVNIVNASKVLLALGPWTSKLLKNCPVTTLKVHSVIVKPHKAEGTIISPYSMFSELQIDENQTFSPEIYPRKDEIYICGEGESLDVIPDEQTDVVTNAEKCDELFYYVSKLSSSVSQGDVTESFASYVPVVNIPSGSGPLLGETDLKNLFIAAGHSCWGINNAPATGVIMSQLLLEGICTCADITEFNPKLYFKASGNKSVVKA